MPVSPAGSVPLLVPGGSRTSELEVRPPFWRSSSTFRLLRPYGRCRRPWRPRPSMEMEGRGRAMGPGRVVF
eukprot:9473745-Pyramimonas_sp.AAC.1